MSQTRTHSRLSHSDKTGERFYHIVVPFGIGLVGFIIAISTMNTAARYVSLYVHLFLNCLVY